MGVSRHALEKNLYEFDQGHRIIYASFFPANELVDAQLLLTLEKNEDRQTFAFSQPDFHNMDKNLVASRGLYIAALKSSPLSPNRVEVGDTGGDGVYFTAKSVKNITPAV